MLGFPNKDRVFSLLVCLSVASATFLYIMHGIFLKRFQHYWELIRNRQGLSLTFNFYEDRSFRNASSVNETLIKESPERDTAAACSEPSLRILYFVHTAPKNVDKRQWLRSTIGDAEIAASVNSTIVFFVGVAPDPNDQQAVEKEAERQRDIVVLNFTDSYRNLTHKFVQGMRWVSDNCLLSSTVTIVKMDDDILVNVFALSSYVSSLYMPETTIHCSVHIGVRPLRNRTSKWYVSKKEYGPKVFPDYCAGAAVVMRPAVMRKLYEATSQVPFFWIDDVYVTGITAAVAGVPLVDIRKYFPLLFARNKTAVPKSTLFINTGRPNKIQDKLGKLWESVIKGRAYKKRRFNLKVVMRARKRLPWLTKWITHIA
ncbi:beta-1,3-galactosyltransferase 5-like [Amblyomma americanum]